MENYYLKSFDDKFNFDSYYLKNQASKNVSWLTRQSIKNYQFGSGLGNNLLQRFKSWVKPLYETHILPFLKSGVKSVGKEAVNTVEKIVFDTIFGNSNIENVVENRISEGIINVKNKIKIKE
jgi:hypothetical protein